MLTDASLSVRSSCASAAASLLSPVAACWLAAGRQYTEVLEKAVPSVSCGKTAFTYVCSMAFMLAKSCGSSASETLVRRISLRCSY